MAGNLSFSVAINLLTDQFNRNAKKLKSGLRSIQMQALGMIAAFGAGSIGLQSFVKDLITVSRETARTSTALKNVSGDTQTYAENQKFLLDISKKYGIYINDLTGSYSKFTAAATMSGIALKDQHKIFEALSRATVNYGLSAEESNGVFLALSQMMGKGTIQAQELKLQMGEKLPVAIQAMAKAAGVSVAAMGKMMEQGKLTTAILPDFADELNKLTKNADLDNIETSFNKLKNTFKELTDKLNVGGIYKSLLDQTGKSFVWIMANFQLVGNGIVNIFLSTIIGKGYNAVKAAIIKNTTLARNSFIAQEVAAIKSSATQTAALLGLKGTAKKAYIEMASDYKTMTASNEFKTRKFAIVAKSAFIALGASIKAAFAAFLPFAIISGLIAIYQHIRNLSQKTKELKAIWNDYVDGYKNIGKNNAQSNELKSHLKIINDTNNSFKDRQNALNVINSILGTSYEFDKNGLKIAGDINTKIQERLGLYAKEAEAKYLAEQKMKASDALDEAKAKQQEAQRNYDHWDTANRTGKNADGSTRKILGLTVLAAVESKVRSNNWETELNNAKNEVNELSKVFNDATKKLNNYISSGTPPPPPPPDATDLTETDLQKAEIQYKNDLKELSNQYKNGVLKQAEYNKAVDDLNKKTYEKVGGLLSEKDATKNKTFQLAKAGVANPLTTKEAIATQELIDEKKKYTDSLAVLKKLRELESITEEEYNSGFISLIESTIKSAISIENIGEASDDFVKGLNKLKAGLPTKLTSKDLSKWDFKSEVDTSITDVEKAQYKLDKAKQELEDLKKNATELTDEVVKQLDDKLANVTGLDKALRLLEAKEKVKDLQKELNSGFYSGVKDIANSAKNLYEAFKAVGDTISNVDSSGWEKFLAIWDALTNTIDSVMSVINMIESLTAVTKTLGLAKQTEAAIDSTVTASKVANAGIVAGAEIAGAAVTAGVSTTKVAANTAVAVSGVAATTASTPIPFPLNVIAIGGAIAGVLGLLASIPKFANGGIVGGSSIGGDKLIARVNSGEMILNNGQQSTLFSLLNGKSGFSSSGGGEVKFVIEGKTLKGVLTNYDKIKNKI